MRAAPIGIADVVRAVEALQPRGAAIEALVQMLGFALVPDRVAAPAPPAPEPPPDPADSDVTANGDLTAAAETLPPSARKLEPVRQATTSSSAWTDPLTATRMRHAQRQSLKQATCQVQSSGTRSSSRRYTGSAGTGYLVSRNRIVTCWHLVEMVPAGELVTVTFTGRAPSAAVVTDAVDARLDVAVLEWREPDAGITPLTFGRTTGRTWEGYGHPIVAPDGRLFSGSLLDPRGRDPSGVEAMVLTSDQLSVDTRTERGGLSGTPIVQDGCVVGHLRSILEEPNSRGVTSATLYATRAEDFVATLLPDETLQNAVRAPQAPQRPPFEGLFAARDAIALLRLAASMPTPSDRIDVARVAHELARARPLLTLPRLRVPSLAFGAQLLVDVGQPMQPFWEDQQELVDRFRRALRSLADVRYVGDDPQEGAGPDRRKGSWKPYALPRAGTPVIALTDLGCGFPPRAAAARAWLELSGRLRRRQCRLVAFAPVRLPRVTMALRRAVDIVVWDGAARRQNLSRLTRVSDE